MTAAQTYTYTIFDADPASAGNCSWPDHTVREIRSINADAALARVLERARLLADNCGEYSDGVTLYARVWDADGVLHASGSVDVAAE